MKDNWLSRLVCEYGASNDGGVQSVLKIIEHYKENDAIIDIGKLIKDCSPETDYQALIKIADEYNLECKIIHKPSLFFLIEGNRPFMFRCKGNRNSYCFLICFSYSSEEGFLIWDYRHGKYFANIKGFSDMWDGNDCLIFLS